MIKSNAFTKNLQAILEGKIIVPVSQTVGFKLTNFEYGKATFKMHVEQRHHNPMATIHGGVYCDIADAAMGVAFGSTLEENESFGTLNFQINFLKTLKEGDIRADGYIIKRGKSIGFLEARITDTAGDIVATAQCTCKVFKLNL